MTGEEVIEIGKVGGACPTAATFIIDGLIDATKSLAQLQNEVSGTRLAAARSVKQYGTVPNADGSTSDHPLPAATTSLQLT